jgi:NDP-sugar pyrophosphorylase family protein
VRQPIVAIDYLGELIEAYFASEPVEFHRHPQATMAEAVLKEAEATTAKSILGMSADVLLGPNAVRLTLDAYKASGELDTVLFAELPSEGQKKWRFIVSDGRLQEIKVSDENTKFERILLVLRRDSLLRIRNELPAPLTNDNVPDELRSYQTGWILLLKTLLRLHVRVAAWIVQVPVCNVNVPEDFQKAETFVAKYRLLSTSFTEQ